MSAKQCSDIDDPIAAATALREEFGGAHKRLYVMLGKAVGIAECLDADPQKLERFKTRVKADGLHVAKTSQRLVMCFLFKAKTPSGAAYERACCYSRVVDHLKEDVDVTAADIPELIATKGGIEELYTAAKNRALAVEIKNTHPTSAKNADTQRRPNSAPAVMSATGLSSGGKKGPPSRHTKKSSGREPRKYTKEWCEQRLILEVDDAALRDALNMHSRQHGSIRFMRGGLDADGFKIFTVQSLRTD